MSLATRNQVWTALPPMRFGEVRPLDLDLDATTLCVLLAARLANYNGGCGSELRVCGPVWLRLMLDVGVSVDA